MSSVVFCVCNCSRINLSLTLCLYVIRVNFPRVRDTAFTLGTFLMSENSGPVRTLGIAFVARLDLQAQFFMCSKRTALEIDFIHNPKILKINLQELKIQTDRKSVIRATLEVRRLKMDWTYQCPKRVSKKIQTTFECCFYIY